MKLVIGKDSKPIVNIYLEMTEDGGVEVCANVGKDLDWLLLSVNPDGTVEPNKAGIEKAGLFPSWEYFKED